MLNLLERPKLRPEDLAPATVAGLYVHVPFCFHKCHYCDFYSITRQGVDRMERYVDLLLSEAELCCAAQPSTGSKLTTVFFGGGTPTLLPENLMSGLLAGLRERAEGWRIALGVLAVFVLYSVLT